MAPFPQLEPTERSFNLGGYSTSFASSFAAGDVRFSHGEDAYGHELTLSFLDISATDAALIRDHHRLQDGSHRSFPIWSATWRGHPTADLLVPFDARWKYAAPPREIHRRGKLYGMTVTVRYVGPLATS